ncbi:hypothetical protein P691DRAFT_673937 [Macrolepiota fuliginosa MF-IS2]|uniref:BTB domain-containing protein n=1 Tax=Macrolepiota fuliginosa MF-IS2 TaxID=1400762 RepID=A0A9P5XBJ3_9AGAR|nr:hypothetical protein P691DRAFT_673937 [Macrolepiota fuliginosa MF-IS2]
MVEGFGENVAPTAAIRAILGSYPFSIGLLREILQNTDDARARKQVFVLDRRSHDAKAIYHPYLAATQGPALLAFNDELIRDHDWEALRNIHRSSKTTDTSKIGKYGVGFRSSYHVTDTPHILSGSHLAILDPKHDFAEFAGVKIGGVKLNIENEWKRYSDHLDAFDPFMPRSTWGKPFPGSVFRLPLRTSASEISHKTISPDEISDLLRDFAAEELNVSLLFLRNVTSIEIYEIGTDGEKMQIATATIDRTLWQQQAPYQIQKAIIQTCCSGSLEKREWRIIHAPFSEEKAIHALTLRLEGNPTTTLSQHKLSPVIDLAVPLNSTDPAQIGRLFTYLPLPLRTEFPVHINALFALTQSRQNLRNAGEVGIVKKSDDRALIEWNHLLFDTYIPQAWAALLQVLVKHDQTEDIFNAWPIPQANVYSGDYVYWKDMPLNVTRHALKLPIWPIFGKSPPSYHPIASVLLAEGSTEENFLTALVRAGLLISRPPQYLAQIILSNFKEKVEVMSPEIVHRKLQLDDAETQRILGYLLSTSNCNFIIGLPLILSVSGGRLALLARSASSKIHPFLDEIEENLFAAYDPKAVSLKRLATDIRKMLVNDGPGVLNVSKLGMNQVNAYLKASSYASKSQEAATSDQIQWLNQFWGWAQKWFSKFANPFYLVPTTRGLQRPTDPVFDCQADKGIATLLELLNVPVIDPRFGPKARGALKQLQPSSNIHSLLRTLPSVINIVFSETQASDLCAHLLRHLPSACEQNKAQISTDNLLRSRLRSLPIFPVITPSSDGTLSTRRASISGDVTVRGVHPLKIPVLPCMGSIIYIDLRSINANILQHIDGKHHYRLSVDEMQDLMLQNFKAQSLETQAAFVKFLALNDSVISRGTLDRLATISFVPTCDGTLQAPKDLVDPRAPISALFPGASPLLPDITRPILDTLISHLRKLHLLITEPSINIIRERIRFIGSGHCPQPEELSVGLIKVINNARFDCRDVFDPSYLSLELEWIPTSEGLKSPLKCRDSSSHSGKKNLFDEIMPMVKPNIQIGSTLREAFPWDDEVSFEILVQQLIRVLDGPQPPYAKVHQIVSELGSRDLTESQFSSLRDDLNPRKWVPTRDGVLESITFALLGGEDIPQIGIRSVGFDAGHHSKMRGFLQEMGCVERPSKETILEHLRSLYTSRLTETMDRHVTQGIIQLLGWLPTPLAPEERDLLFIPDVTGALRPFDSLCYNDVGARASLVNMGSNALAHTSISSALASDLGLRRLGLMNLQDIDDDLDMGEDLLTTIRNRLREYTDSQILLEFLANASDAGAAEFNVLLDEQPAPIKNLLSPRCSEFQSVPTLVIHNDSVFSDNDFKGILRTGTGGKIGRKDTIGQFGLGSLTMFHITEFAMIVSRDQVLFLNPCKHHLAFDRRASLRLPLSIVRRDYGDHLSPLIGMFEFDPPDDIDEDYSYKGTIFRLPLRSSGQLDGIEPIFRTSPSLHNLVSNFEELASKCLLFTSVTSIQLFERKYRETLCLWSVTASRRDFSWVEENINANTILITSSKGAQEESQEWRVLTISANEHRLPPFISSLQNQYRLRLPPVLRIAACSSPNPTHNLFSTLPLPIPLDLPVHISGSFILASDRRSVRLDEYENLEASYNRWLLTTIFPKLYLSLLVDRASDADNAAYWPGNAKIVQKDTYDVISTLVMDAVYQVAATSYHPLLRSKFHPHALSLRTASLVLRLPRAASKVLEALRPADIAHLPTPVIRRLQNVKDNVLSLVTAKYIHDLILNNLSRFSASILDLSQLKELIKYLSKDADAIECLIGLPLLPLEDGSFTRFDVFPDTCFYVAPAAADIFAAHRLVHRDLVTKGPLELDPRLNVSEITRFNIGTLINDYIPESITLEHADASTRTWIGKFWKIFPSLSVSLSAVSSYPLIPTLQSGLYLSLDHCKSHSVILSDFSDQGLSWLPQCLAQMGFTLINAALLPGEVRSALKPPYLTVESILSKLLNHPTNNVSTLFEFLDSKMRVSLISWIRTDFSSRKKAYFQKHWNYRFLPIWRSANNSFVSADDAVMLPRNIASSSVAPFVSPTAVGYDILLATMGFHPPASLRSILTIPSYLGEQQEGAYRTLVRILISNTPPGSGIPVPNSSSIIQESTSLYSSRDDLFVAAFGDNSDRFLLSSFRNLEGQLEQFGLKRQLNLDMAMFRTCIETFQTATDESDRVERATVIYKVFCEDLPVRATGANQETQWRPLGELSFIPRNTSPHPLGTADDTKYVNPYVRSLPDVVSPNQLVRREFLPIAWSQRALYVTQPHQRVLMTYPSLSIPTVEDVVDHLVVLATKVARDFDQVGSCRIVLLEHLEETYRWLNGHAKEAERHLRRYSDLALFLNDGFPPSENAREWNWKKADNILLDEYDTGYLQCPRGFISSFRALLTAAGAVTIKHGEPEVEFDLPEQQITVDEPDRVFDGICVAFDQMRKDGICTDVSFVCDSPDNEPLRAHRAYLAAYSAHFREMFKPGFSEAGKASDAEPIVVPVPAFSRRCVEYLLDYAYTGKAPQLKRDDPDTDVALEMLTLAHSWSMADAQRAVQSIIIKLKMVDPFSLDNSTFNFINSPKEDLTSMPLLVRLAAHHTESKELLYHCSVYEMNNANLVRQVREQGATTEQN